MGEGGEDASHLLAIYEIAQTSGIGICVDVEASYFLKSAESVAPQCTQFSEEEPAASYEHAGGSKGASSEGGFGS